VVAVGHLLPLMSTKVFLRCQVSAMNFQLKPPSNALPSMLPTEE